MSANSVLNAAAGDTPSALAPICQPFAPLGVASVTLTPSAPNSQTPAPVTPGPGTGRCAPSAAIEPGTSVTAVNPASASARRSTSRR